MEVLSTRDEARLAEVHHLLADLDRSCDDTDVVQQIAELVDVDLTANMRFEYDRDRLLIADAASAGPDRFAKRDLERMKRGIRDGHMQFLFSSPVPERAQRNRLTEFSCIRSSGRDAPKLGITTDAIANIRPRLQSLIAFYEEIGIAEMHNARVLVCDGPLLLRYVAIARHRPFTRRQRALFVRCTQALRRRTVLDHRRGVDSTYRAAFTVAIEAFGSAAFMVDRHGRVVHANQLGVTALDHERDLSAQLADAVAGNHDHFDVHPLNQRGSANAFIVVRRSADLCQIAATFAREHGFTGRARDVFVAAATGESTKYIAARLGIADNTVEYHLTKVFRAVGVDSRAELQRALTERLLGTRARAQNDS